MGLDWGQPACPLVPVARPAERGVRRARGWQRSARRRRGAAAARCAAAGRGPPQVLGPHLRCYASARSGRRRWTVHTADDSQTLGDWLSERNLDARAKCAAAAAALFRLRACFPGAEAVTAASRAVNSRAGRAGAAGASSAPRQPWCPPVSRPPCQRWQPPLPPALPAAPTPAPPLFVSLASLQDRAQPIQHQAAQAGCGAGGGGWAGGGGGASPAPVGPLPAGAPRPRQAQEIRGALVLPIFLNSYFRAAALGLGVGWPGHLRLQGGEGGGRRPSPASGRGTAACRCPPVLAHVCARQPLNA